MFTGIVEEMGTLKAIRKGPHSAVLEIQAKVVLEDIHLGDSIAVNGVCLTATSYSPTGFTADVMHETLNRSALATLRPGSRVNLERAMAANGRFGGHNVAGHGAGVGPVQRITRDDNAIWYTIACISLTVAKVDRQSFAISAIPHTVSVTVLADRKVGDRVNLETDIIGKYVEKLLQPAPEAAPQPAGGGITREFLTRYGF